MNFCILLDLKLSGFMLINVDVEILPLFSWYMVERLLQINK